VEEVIILGGEEIKTRPLTTKEKTRYREIFEKINKESKIQELKKQLSDSDYKAIKYFEGWITEEEYAPIKAERQAIREEINSLENE